MPKKEKQRPRGKFRDGKKGMIGTRRELQGWQKQNDRDWEGTTGMAKQTGKFRDTKKGKTENRGSNREAAVPKMFP